MEKRTSRVSEAQWAILLEFLESNPNLARSKGFNNTAQGRNQASKLWQEVTNLLNAEGSGVTKAPKDWAICNKCSRRTLQLKMPWSACQLDIKQNNNCGTLITGQIIEDLVCKIVGTYKASWSRPMPTMPFIRNYSAKEIVIEIILDIFPEYREITLVPGLVTKEFSFYLSEDIPSSFKGSLGKVNYFIELEAKGHKQCRKKQVFPLTVHRKSSLNEENKLSISKEYKFYKNILYNGKIEFIMKTLKCFLPPQIIPFNVDIVNEKSVKIDKVKVALVQLVRYHSRAGYADMEKHICNVEEVIQSNCSQISKSFHMDANKNSIVPTSYRNTMEINHLLEIKYEFHIEYVLPFHFNVFEKIQVIVLSS